MKTIIAISNNGKTGKTESLRVLAKMLLENYPDVKKAGNKFVNVPPNGDFRFVAEIKSKKIGIESEGNPDSLLKERLGDLTQLGCEIIFCTSRTRGETVKTIEEVAKKNGFQVTWTSTYQAVNTEKHRFFNELKAKHLWELVEKMHLFD